MHSLTRLTGLLSNTDSIQIVDLHDAIILMMVDYLSQVDESQNQQEDVAEKQP